VTLSQLRGVGLDAVANLIHDGFIRPIVVNGEQYGSLVDVMSVFSGAKNPRQYWKDHKRQLLHDDPELVENLYRLKLPASDSIHQSLSDADLLHSDPRDEVWADDTWKR
jgi:hypothetical protein